MNPKWASFSRPVDEFFEKQHILDLTREFQKAEHRINYLCRLILFISLHRDVSVRAQELNSRADTPSRREQHFMNIQKGLNLSLRLIPQRDEKQTGNAELITHFQTTNNGNM